MWHGAVARVLHDRAVAELATRGREVHRAAFGERGVLPSCRAFDERAMTNMCGRFANNRLLRMVLAPLQGACHITRQRPPGPAAQAIERRPSGPDACRSDRFLLQPGSITRCRMILPWSNSHTAVARGTIGARSSNARYGSNLRTEAMRYFERAVAELAHGRSARHYCSGIQSGVKPPHSRALRAIQSAARTARPMYDV